METSKTITDNYLEEQIILHKNPNYGTASLAFGPLVKGIIDTIKPNTVSDYGAGKKNLEVALRKFGEIDFEYYPYDPAFPEYGPAKKADLVCCIDVLEHIEPELLDNVLKDLKDITVNIGFFSIHTGPAQKTLSDGRNAHLIQKPQSWWLPLISKYFEVIHLESHKKMDHKGFWIIVQPSQIF